MRLRHVAILPLLCLLAVGCMEADAFDDMTIRFIQGGGGGGAAAYCDSCTGTADADTLCEDFEGSTACGDGSHSNCQCAWDQVDVDDGTIDFNASHTNTWCCADKGDYGLKIITHTSNDTHVRKDYGSNTSNFYMQMYIDFVAENLANTEEVSFFRAASSSYLTMTRLLLYQDGSGNLKLRAKWSDSAPEDMTVDSTMNLSVGHVYRIRVLYAPSDETVEIADCDGGNSETVLDGVAATETDVRYFDWGDTSTSAAACTFEMDNIKLDDDTAISSGCSE